MLKMVDGTGIIGLDMVCPLGGAVSPPQPPNYDNIEMEGVGSLMLPNSLKAPLERVELIGNSTQGENPAPDNPQEIESAGRFDEASGKYLLDVKVTGKNRYDIEKAKIIDNWEECPTMSTYKDFPIYVGKGNEFSLSFSENLQETKSEIVAGVALVKSSGINKWIYDMGSNFNQSYSGFAKEDYIYIRSNRHRIQYFVKDIKTLQVEVNPIPTDFQPYTEQSLTLTSDRPITKWDKLVEQGGQYGWLYKHRIVNDLSALVKDSEPIYGKDGEKYFSVSLQGALFNYDYNKIYSVAGLCPKDSKIHYVPKPMLQSVVIYVSDTDTIMTAKEHMHYKVIYETIESQFVPLPESEQTQLRNLHSYNGTTNITVDSGEVPCGIKLTYRKEI